MVARKKAVEMSGASFNIAAGFELQSQGPALLVLAIATCTKQMLKSSAIIWHVCQGDNSKQKSKLASDLYRLHIDTALPSSCGL